MVTKGKKGQKGKDKGKGKSKSKSKDDGKGKSFFVKLSKGKFDNGKSKGKEKGRDGKGKDPRPACHNCGKKGHLARDCWSPKRVNQVTQDGPPTAGPSASSRSTEQDEAETAGDEEGLDGENQPGEEAQEDYDPSGDEEWLMQSEHGEDEEEEMGGMIFHECEDGGSVWTPPDLTASAGVTKAKLTVRSADGRNEQFALGRVRPPLLCAGKDGPSNTENVVYASEPKDRDDDPCAPRESQPSHEGQNSNGLNQQRRCRRSQKEA